MSHIAKILPGDALETLRVVEGPVDLVFLDGRKDLYLPVLMLLEAKLRPGAVILSDNVFSFKREVAPFLEYVQSGKNGFASSTLNISDGIGILDLPERRRVKGRRSNRDTSTEGIGPKQRESRCASRSRRLGSPRACAPAAAQFPHRIDRLILGFIIRAGKQLTNQTNADELNAAHHKGHSEKQKRSMIRHQSFIQNRFAREYPETNSKTAAQACQAGKRRTAEGASWSSRGEISR